MMTMKHIRHLALLLLAPWVFVAGQNARAQTVSDWIESSGLGPSEEKATMEALRSAIQQVVGVFIDAETIVANEDVIKDQILDYSAGYIEDYERISTTPKDGLIEVRLRAKVKRERLEARIKDKARCSPAFIVEFDAICFAWKKQMFPNF